MTYADLLRPAARRQAALYDLALVLGGSLLVAASARFEVHLPFSPVPITGQTFAVLLLGAVLGARRAAATLLAYLAEGAAGLPVFAGGAGGFLHLLGPTGGYLIGFVGAAYVTGALAERGWDRRPATAFAAILAGNAVIYLFGLPWLARFVGPDQALPLGLLPFIPGDLVKAVLATALLPAGWRLLTALGQPMHHPNR